MQIDEAARRIGELAWVEQRLFEVLGAWAASTAEPGLKVAFATESRLHGDHVLTLTGVLPDTRDHDPEQAVAPPPVDPTAPLDGLLEPGDRLRTLLDEVLPAHLGELERFVAEASPVSDGPARRAVATVLDDDRAAAEAGRAWLDR